MLVRGVVSQVLPFKTALKLTAAEPLAKVCLAFLHGYLTVKPCTEAELRTLVLDSKLSLTLLLPLGNRSEDALLCLLEKHALDFLFPLLQVKKQLLPQLAQHLPLGRVVTPETTIHPGTKALSVWIKALPESSRTDPKFVHVLSASVFVHVATLMAEAGPTAEKVI